MENATFNGGCIVHSATNYGPWWNNLPGKSRADLGTVCYPRDPSKLPYMTRSIFCDALTRPDRLHINRASCEAIVGEAAPKDATKKGGPMMVTSDATIPVECIADSAI